MEPHPHFTGEEVGPGKARGPYQVMEANDKRRAGAPHPAPYGESFPPPQPASPLASLLHQAFCIMGTTQGAKEPRTSEDIREQTGRPREDGALALLCHRLSFAEGPRLSKAALKSRRRSSDPRHHFGRLVNKNGMLLVSQALRDQLLNKVAFAFAAN